MERDDTLVGSARWFEPSASLPVATGANDLEPVEFLAAPQPALLDADTAKAIRALCWTLCWLLWLISAIAVLFVVAVAVAVVNGSVLPA